MHKSVLLEESIKALQIKEDGIYVDATLGYGGHSYEILRRLKRGFLFAFDQDSNAILVSHEKLEPLGSNYKLISSNFENMVLELKNNDISGVDGIIFDLGVSSPQIDDASRGFSFMKDATLDMRMNQKQKFSALELINQYQEKDLFKVFIKYGEEKFSKQIAKKIIEVRKTKEIKTTLELVEIIKSSVPYKYFITRHPERRIFQAIRIEVNKELEVLENTLPEALKLLNKGGRLVVITFHSLEDRIVKNIFKDHTNIPDIIKGDPNISKEYLPKYKLITKKPIIPTQEEIKENSRSASSKLRIIERI
ncbi:MAG: 16S rRNA (cytosine(1402)-N(4))-methyltransferase RsmH [Mollicutes bacterium]|jgi:16S rRNA (cytosine1402-N4)-methyltransferase|nr:16S rRNA (cytosine(1402)-N(4))-methyltransferase RsmH [Mollicutes bacterium]